MTKKTAYNYALEILGEMKHAIVKCGKDTTCIEGVQLLTLYRVLGLLRDEKRRDLTIGLIWLLCKHDLSYMIDITYHAESMSKGGRV